MKRARTRMMIVGLVTLVAATNVGIESAGAAGEIACAPRTLRKAFAQFGDTNDYFVVNDGTFENGAGGWRVTAPATTTTQQAPWKVNGATHRKSLLLGSGATAKTPSTCVTVGEDWMRFFYRPVANGGVRPTRTAQELTVTITAVSDQGTATSTVVIPDTASTSWQVSPQIAIPNVRGEKDEQWVTITFATAGVNISWLIDDVMIDPFKVR